MISNILTDIFRITIQRFFDAYVYNENKDGYTFMIPRNIDDLISESQGLKHCVKGYAKRMATQELVIVFMREEDNPTKPLYTIEISDFEVRQARGFKNENVSNNIRRIINSYNYKINKKLNAASNRSA